MPETKTEDRTERLVSLRQAMQQIRTGDHIFVGSGSAVPLGLLPGLVADDVPFVDNEILHLMTLGDAPYAEARFTNRFRHNALFIGPNVRHAIQAGRGDYTPVFLSEIPGLIRAGRIEIDVALIAVTPPDQDGFCSLGTHVDIAPAAIEAARLVIAEVNPSLPRTCGPGRVHIDRIDAMVAADHPLPELSVPKDRSETEAIARHIAELIPDGATLQLGIGGIPDGVLRFLRDRKDLGIHTEMFSDGVVDLIERGVINGCRKTLHPGKVITSFVMGSKRTYDFLNDNPDIEFHPVDHTNDPFVIAQNDNMIAINTCLQVDLTGQVCADSIGSRFYSGIGGQVDFIRGAARSRGGKPVIAMPSTACDGNVSRIMPRLDDGAGVVTTRGDVHWIVTEYGAVNLHGLNIRERATALVSVAHPRFRPWLLAEAKRLHFVTADHPEPPIHMPLYPKPLETRARTRDDEALLIRPIKQTDEPLFRDMFYGLSRETIYQRFFSARKSMPRRSLQRHCTIDYDSEMTLVVVVSVGDVERIVASASYSVDPETGFAEAAFVVEDPYQRRGIGTLLMHRLTEIAEARGVRGFTATVLASNTRMLRAFGKCGYAIEQQQDGDTVTLRIPFDDKPRAAWSPTR